MSSTSIGGRQLRAAPTPAGARRPRSILARLDRINVWSMPFLFVGIIGLGFMFAFYDVFDINVSFIQSCVALKPGCTPANAVTALRVPVVLNLAGYVIGALLLAPLSDRFGRRNMLLFTMLLTGLGSLYNALAPDYTNFVIARVITGIGVGADLAIVNTYVGEVAPRRNRARWISVIFIMSSLGALLGIWLGLFLTTPVRALAARPAVRPGRPGLRKRLALDVCRSGALLAGSASCSASNCLNRPAGSSGKDGSTRPTRW